MFFSRIASSSSASVISSRAVTHAHPWSGAPPLGVTDEPGHERHAVASLFNALADLERQDFGPLHLLVEELHNAPQLRRMTSATKINLSWPAPRFTPTRSQ